MSTRKNIVGNMTGDPDLKFGQNGNAWATFTVASNEGKDENKVTCYTRCKAFGELAENITASLAKGMRVVVSGRERTEEWERDGQKQSMNVLHIDAIGPDLRYAQAKVTRTSNVMSGSGQVRSTPVTGAGFAAAAGVAANDPWAPSSEGPGW